MVSKVGATALGALLFFSMAWISLEWGNVKPSLLWLSTGAVTMAALHLGPARQWWAVGGGAIGGLLAGPLLFDDTLPEMLAPVVGNTLESALILLGLPLVLGGSLRIRTTSDGLWVVAILTGSAAIGGLIAVLGDASTIIGDPLEAWSRWTLGNTIGEFLLVPLVLFRGSAVMHRPESGPPVEMLVTFSMIAGVAIVTMIVDSALLYLVIPLILWIAIRFGPAVAAPVGTVTVTAVWAATVRGHGPFIELHDDPALQAQIFTLSVTTCVIVGGAHAVRSWNDRRRLIAVLSALPDILFIRQREGGELLSSWVPRGSEALANTLEPTSAEVLPTIDLESVERVEPVMMTADDSILERRTVPVDDDGELDLFRDVSVEQRALRELRLRREVVEDARWAERQRLGRALHDSPVQLLAAALIRLDVAGGEGADAAENLAKVKELTRLAMDELRDKLGELMPPDVEEGGVVAALSHLARQLLGDDVTVVPETDVAIAPSADVSKILFLVGREAVSNVALHSQATRVEITLGESDDDLVLTITDDGIGLPESRSPRGSYGVDLMRERSKEYGGKLSIESGSDGGTIVMMAMPITDR